MRIINKVCIQILLLLILSSNFSFAKVPKGRYDNDGGVAKKAYYDKVEATKARLKNDTAFNQLNQAYDIFKKYAVEISTTRFDMIELRQLNWEEKSIEIPEDGDPTDYAMGEREWVVRMDDAAKQTKVVDSVNALNHPFFERIHRRSEAACKDRILVNDTLRELSDVLLAWYLKNGKKDYFVEKTDIRYTTKPCIRPISPKTLDDFFNYDPTDICLNGMDDYQKVDTLCVDTKGLDYKRIFLSSEDEDALDVFSGCDRWTGSTKEKDDRYNKNGFLPFEISYNWYDMCFDYGSEYISKIHLDLEKGEAILIGATIEYYIRKVDGVWRYVDFSIHGFID